MPPSKATQTTVGPSHGVEATVDYRYSNEKDLARVALAGRIETGYVAWLKEPFQRAYTQGLKHVELDFGALAHIGSSGIAVLIQAQKILES